MLDPAKPYQTPGQDLVRGRIGLVFCPLAPHSRKEVSMRSADRRLAPDKGEKGATSGRRVCRRTVRSLRTEDGPFVTCGPVHRPVSDEP